MLSFLKFQTKIHGDRKECDGERSSEKEHSGLRTTNSSEVTETGIKALLPRIVDSLSTCVLGII